MLVRVLLSDSERVLDVEVPEGSCVSTLHDLVLQADNELCTKHHLRYIFRGRLLELSALLEEAGVQQGDFVHCAVADLYQQDTDVVVPLVEEDDEPSVNIAQHAEATLSDWCKGFTVGALFGLLLLVLSLDKDVDIARRWKSVLQ